MITLDYADAAQRFGEPAGDFSVDFAALAENGANCLECALQGQPEADHHSDGDAGHQGADAKQENQRNYRREQTADEFDQPGADEIPHALDVRHDARHELAGFVRVEESHGKAADMLLDFLPQFRDHLLAFDGK